MDAVYFNCSSNRWWQYSDLTHAIEASALHCRGWDQVITYGSSMGGYAALRFAGALGAVRAVAICPQYSPSPSVVIGENRFSEHVSDGDLINEKKYRINSNTVNYVLYDDFYKKDVQHVDLYGAEAPVRHVRLSCCGHPPTITLEQTGMISSVIASLITGVFVEAEFRQQFRAVRRQSEHYWKELAFRLIERQSIDLAKAVIMAAEQKFHSEQWRILLNDVDRLASAR